MENFGQIRRAIESHKQVSNEKRPRLEKSYQSQIMFLLMAISLIPKIFQI